jgi:TetR/AcrR family transcriptional repressor of nem operon
LLEPAWRSAYQLAKEVLLEYNVTLNVGKGVLEMRKSKVETAETRKRIVTMASKVFLEQGLAATGISEIMVAAGLTQGGFYRHFESKEQLIAEASEAAFDQAFEAIGKVVAGMAPQEALDKVVHIYLYQRQTKDTTYLCPLASLGSELPHADEHVKAIANGSYKRMVGFIAGLTQQLNVADYAGVADAIVSTMLGAVTIARLALTDASAEAILANAQNTINILLQSSQKAGTPA